MTSTFKHAKALRRILERSVVKSGKHLQNFSGAVSDVVVEGKDHEASTIDVEARMYLVQMIKGELKKTRWAACYDWDFGTEDDPELWQMTSPYAMAGKPRVFLFIDELDGTTNTKRAIDAPIPTSPRSAISIAAFEDVFIGGGRKFICSGVYSLEKKMVFSAEATDSRIPIAFQNRKPVDINLFQKPLTVDSKPRVILAEYSNIDVLDITYPINKMLRESGVEVYGGCRSSSADLIDVFARQYEAYVDVRALTIGHHPTLKEYDYSGMDYFGLGCGFVAMDVLTGAPLLSLESHRAKSVVIGRKEVVDTVMAVVNKYLHPLKTGNESAVLETPQVLVGAN